jgi:hypothetical protein
VLTAILYQGNPDRMIGTTSSRISYQLRDIYPIRRSCWNNATYEWKVHNGKPIEIEIKDTTDTDRFASYLYLHLEIGSEGRLRTKRQKRRVPFSHCELSIHM